MSSQPNSFLYGIDPATLYTKKEVAAHFKASVNTVSKWLTLGKLQRTKVGGGVRILGENLIKFVEDSTNRTG